MPGQMLKRRRNRLRAVSVLGAMGLLVWSVAALRSGPIAAGQETAVNEETALDRVLVTMTAGEEGEPLSEAVDLHLGLGFPLRLFPLGTDQRTPAFAAFPQKSSLPKGATSLKPGETATFEFLLKADAPGLDVLRSTPELFRDLNRADPQRAGFASLGRTDWVLKGFKVEINGRNVTSNADANLHPRQLQRTNQARLQEKTADFEVLLHQVTALEATALTGLATDGELARLQELQSQMETAANELNALAAVVMGALPWHQTGNDPPENRIRTLDVTLTPQDGKPSGSRNPIYLWIDGRKFALTSEADPLADGATPQSFRISTAELDANPVVRERVKEIGIGMVAADDLQPAAAPDFARLKRVQVLADGQPLYDSQRVPGDRETLRKLVLSPPVFRGEKGGIRQIALRGPVATLWKSGSVLPEGTAEDAAFPDEPLPADDPTLDPSTGEPAPLDPGALAPPQLPPPVVALVPFDDSGLNSPRRRRPRRRGGRTPVVINITTPSVPAPRKKKPGSPNTTPAPTAPAAGATPAAGNGSGPAAPRPVVPTPAPAAPVLAAIKVNPAIPILRDGDASNVTWTVSGPTTNVASYRVDLFGVLPHKNPPLINTPLATLANVPTGSGSQLARMPAIQVSKISGQLPGASAQYLYVQPKVTALASNGTAIVSGFGSILPLFPASTPSPDPASLLPGQLVANGLPVAAAAPPPAFQVLPAGAAPLAWKSSPALDPQTVSTSWPLNGEQDSSFALTFASYVPPGSVTPLPAYNAAVRPATNNERIAIQYEGAVPLPSSLPTPAKGYRLVGHVAFLGGTAPANALVQTQINAFARPAAATPFFTMQSPAPISYAKFSSGTTPAPCLLIDMPVRFDLMKSNTLASSPHDASKYQITSFVPAGPTGFSSVGNAGGGSAVYLQCTFMIAQQSTTTTDAVGVFGLRLVPDNN